MSELEPWSAASNIKCKDSRPNKNRPIKGLFLKIQISNFKFQTFKVVKYQGNWLTSWKMCVCTHAAVVKVTHSERTKVQGFGEIVHKAKLLNSELRREPYKMSIPSRLPGSKLAASYAQGFQRASCPNSITHCWLLQVAA